MADFPDWRPAGSSPAAIDAMRRTQGAKLAAVTADKLEDVPPSQAVNVMEFLVECSGGRVNGEWPKFAYYAVQDLIYRVFGVPLFEIAPTEERAVIVLMLHFVATIYEGA